MKNVFNIEIRQHIQDKGLIFWIFILPIVFTILFISVFTSTVDNSIKDDVITSIVPGYTVMFVFFIIISMGTSFIHDRDTGWIARLASTPLSSLHYLIGKSLSFFLVVLIQIIVLQTFGKIIYTIPMEQPVFLFLLALALTSCVIGIGLAISVTIRTNNMGIAITQIIALVGALVGGLWVPFDMMPDVLQKIGSFTPQYWAHTGFKQAMNGTLNVTDLCKVIAVLLGYSFAGLFSAYLIYPNFLKQAKS